MPSNSKFRLMYLLLLLVGLVWLAAICLPPWLLAKGHTFSAVSLYRGLSGICHQIPGRSFQLLGFPLAVCSRCTGIYLGFVIGVMLYPFFYHLNNLELPPRFWLMLGSLPMLIDVGGDLAGVFSNTFFSRTATGLFAGATAAFFVLPAWMAIANSRPAEPNKHFKENYSA